MSARAVGICRFDCSWRVCFLEDFTHMTVLETPWASPLGCLSVLGTGQLTSPWANFVFERERFRSHSVFYDIISDVTHCHFHFILVTRSKRWNPSPIRVGESRIRLHFFEGKVKECVDLLTNHNDIIFYTEAQSEAQIYRITRQGSWDTKPRDSDSCAQAHNCTVKLSFNEIVKFLGNVSYALIWKMDTASDDIINTWN